MSDEAKRLEQRAREHTQTLGGDPRGRALAPPQETVDRFYVEFEKKFRGAPADLQRRMSAYVPHIRKVPPAAKQLGALDVGCGWGDWLAVANSEGWAARGVDANAAMVAMCKRSGFEAIHDDALAYVAACEDESVGLITSFHLVEHLPFEVLLGWALHCERVLSPGGMLIAETPNPENYRVGAYSFYYDLTHRNPIPPATLEFVLSFAGFEPVETLRLHPREKGLVPPISSFARFVSNHFDTYEDYGVIARKPVAPGSP